MTYEVIATDEFEKQVHIYRKRNEFLRALDKLIKRLEQDPHSIGGKLVGPLHGKNSTRVLGKWRVIFRVDDNNVRVYVLACRHRREGYRQQ